MFLWNARCAASDFLLGSGIMKHMRFVEPRPSYAEFIPCCFPGSPFFVSDSTAGHCPIASVHSGPLPSTALCSQTCWWSWRDSGSSRPELKTPFITDLEFRERFALHNSPLTVLVTSTLLWRSFEACDVSLDQGSVTKWLFTHAGLDRRARKELGSSWAECGLSEDFQD